MVATDPSYLVLSCVNSYLNQEKPLLSALLDISDVSMDLYAKATLASVHEEENVVLNMNSFSNSRWSQMLRGNTTTFTLQNIYANLLRQLCKAMQKYTKYAHRILREENFSLPYAKVQKEFEDYKMCLDTEIKTHLETIVRRVMHFDGVRPDDDANFAMYDDKCMVSKKLLELVLEAHMSLDTIVQAPNIDMEPYEMYAKLN